MQRRHSILWEWVHAYIVEHDIHNVFEIGCGQLPLVRQWVPHYQGVDLNITTDALHDDFLTMELSPWLGTDLVLACGVIEHCPEGFSPFLHRICAMKPKHAVVSFFNGLRQAGKDFAYEKYGYFFRGYSGASLIAWLDENAPGYELRKLSSHDVVLILQESGEEKKRFSLDHNHKTKQVRGIVCDRCNLIIGMIEKEPAIVSAVQEYLSIWNNNKAKVSGE